MKFPSIESLPTVEELENEFPPYTCPICLDAKSPDAKWAVVTFKNSNGKKRALPVCMDCVNADKNDS